jgi:hypothetical protein
LNLSDEEIVSLIRRYEKDTKAIKEDILRMCWYMRGSISYNDAMLLGEDERKIINKIIEGNLEIAKKSGLPFF